MASCGSSRMTFFADDGFSVASPKAAIEAAVRFAKDLFVNTGCTVERMSVYSPGYDLTHCPYRLAAEAELGIEVEVAGRTDTAGVFQQGVVVLGVPIGTQQFESLFYEECASKVESKIDTTVTLLRSADSASLGALNFSCLQSMGDYQLRLAATAQSVQAFAAAVDAAVLRACAVSQLPSFLGDALVVRRLRLPARLKGGGVRSRSQLAMVASVAGFVDAAQQFLDSAETGPGFFNNLSGLFGAGAFDVGGARFTHFIAAGSPRAASFAASWASMRAELGDGVDDEVCMGCSSTRPRWRG